MQVINQDHYMFVESAPGTYRLTEDEVGTWFAIVNLRARGTGWDGITVSGGGRFTVLGKWMHDFSAENRFESDYVTLTGAWKF